MRALVHEPRKTASILIFLLECQVSGPCIRVRVQKALRSASVALGSGMGTVPLTPVDHAGREVPQLNGWGDVDGGDGEFASKIAPVSVTSSDQCWTASPHAVPCGESGDLSGRRRWWRRGRFMPRVLRPRMLMLQMVMRPSMERLRMAEPAYSMTWPVAPAVPNLTDDMQHDVLGGDADGKCAFEVDAEGFGFVLREGLRGHDVLDFAGAGYRRLKRRRLRGCWCGSRRRRWSCRVW